MGTGARPQPHVVPDPGDMVAKEREEPSSCYCEPPRPGLSASQTVRAGGFSPGCAFCSEQLGCVVDHSGLILVLSTEGTGFFICELFKSLKTCLKRNMALKILGVITYEQHFYF